MFGNRPHRWHRALACCAILVAGGCGPRSSTLEPCDGVTCSDHGSCFEHGGSPQCECEPGYHPADLRCVLDVMGDECQGVECSGHGACRVEDRAPRCDCDRGYESSGYDLHCLPTGEPVTDAGPEASPDAEGDGDGDVAFLPCEGERLWDEGFHGSARGCDDERVMCLGDNVGNVRWTPAGEALRYTGGARTGGGHSLFFVGEGGWTDHRIEARVTVEAVVSSGTFAGLVAGVVLGEGDPEHYRLELSARSGGILLIDRSDGGSIAHRAVTIEPGVPYMLALEVRGSRLRAWVNGELFAEHTAPAGPIEGRSGLLATAGQSLFEDVRIMGCE